MMGMRGVSDWLLKCLLEKINLGFFNYIIPNRRVLTVFTKKLTYHG